MPPRVPPGRVGRAWLQRRLAVAHRSVDVLDQKRRALIKLERALDEEMRETGAAWVTAAEAAAEWLARASTLSGPRRLNLVAHYTPPAAIDIRRENTLGVVHPSHVELSLPPRTDTVALGGSSAVASAVDAHRRALDAAATHAAIATAHRAVSSELAATTRRVRAIERRWIPMHEHALERLELQLDEGEREDLARLRWLDPGP